MASLRRVRRDFRKGVLRLIKAGEGSSENLLKLADTHYGSNECGYHAVLRAFLQGEVSNAVSQLREDGQAETVGMSWKSTDNLESEDVDIIVLRRLKRVRGELKSLGKFAHDHGRADVAATACQVVSLVNLEDESAVVDETTIDA